MDKKVFSLLIGLSVTLTIDFSTEPTMPPYQSYQVSGNVVCDTLHNLGNYAVTLFGKSFETQNKFIMIPEYFNDHGKYVDLTDSTGKYFLIADVPYKMDSLKAAIIFHDEETKFSHTFSHDDFQAREDIEFFETGNSGCRSCTNEPFTNNRIIRYTYNIDSIKINICL